ncbi:MAG: hypothetical protein R3185_06210, partial [Candidatus Thermoplasmatota archaeon]|nr:hypothetical protein [Candidatus Thermoplasmatota archaeon]
MDWVLLGALVAALAAGVIVVVYLLDRPSKHGVCPRCGAGLAADGTTCKVCEAPFEPPAARPDSRAPFDEVRT